MFPKYQTQGKETGVEQLSLGQKDENPAKERYLDTTVTKQKHLNSTTTAHIISDTKVNKLKLQGIRIN